jgi:hypothetical protein
MNNQQLQAHVKSGPMVGFHRLPTTAIHCADNFSVSVQASATHYCTPRDNEGPYTHFELGFPSQADELIQVYAEDPSKPTDTVYPWVPLETVLTLLAKHGGRVEIIDI